MSSQYKILPRILEIIHLNLSSINKILDLGAGFGRFGREFRIQFDNSLERGRWKYMINAVEVFPKYRSILSSLDCYDGLLDPHITIEEIKNYDLVVLMEVIEHQTKSKALKWLDYIIQNNKYIILSTPKGFFEHSAVDNNPYQEHKSGFSRSELKKLGFKVELIKTFGMSYLIAYSPNLMTSKPLKYKIPLKIRQML